MEFVGREPKVSAQVRAMSMQTYTQKVKNTHTVGIETIGVFDATGRCCCLHPAVPYLAPVGRWAVSVSNDTQTLALHTLISTITTTIITSALCDSPDLCVSAWACLCVHRTGTCLPFGGMYSIWWCEKQHAVVRSRTNTLSFIGRAGDSSLSTQGQEWRILRL